MKSRAMKRALGSARGQGLPVGAAVLWLCAVASHSAHAQSTRVVSISQVQAVELARRGSPEVAASRGREAIAHSDVGIAGTYPNPSATFGTSTQVARFTADVSVPLVIFGQRGASIDASRADLATAQVDTEVLWN